MSELPESARESHAAGALTDAARGNYYCNHPGMTCSGCVVKVDGEGMLEDLRMEGWDMAPVSPAVEEPGHERCACGNAATEGLGEGTYWFADNALWNAVNGSPNGFLCPPCFTTMAREKGYAVGWRAGVIGEIETDPADVARLRAEVERLREALTEAGRLLDRSTQTGNAPTTDEWRALVIINEALAGSPSGKETPE